MLLHFLFFLPKLNLLHFTQTSIFLQVFVKHVHYQRLVLTNYYFEVVLLAPDGWLQIVHVQLDATNAFVKKILTTVFTISNHFLQLFDELQVVPF